MAVSSGTHNQCPTEATKKIEQHNSDTKTPHIQRHKKGKTKITSTGGKNNLSIEISTNLLPIKEVIALPLSFDY
jgi:hypothetical protein